jgi:hypothetical protein
MTLLEAIRAAVCGGPPACAACTHFCTDPLEIEAELPGLVALSSAHGSVRAQDGLCRLHLRLSNGRRPCSEFTPLYSSMEPTKTID